MCLSGCGILLLFFFSLKSALTKKNPSFKLERLFIFFLYTCLFNLRDWADTGQQQHSLQQQYQHQQPIYADEANGKINIHVSVVFVKSLSDLKKQRAQNRTSVVGSSNQQPQEQQQQPQQQQQQIETNGNGLAGPLAAITGNNSTDYCNDDFRRFTGNTSDIMGETRTEKSCCAVMWKCKSFFFWMYFVNCSFFSTSKSVCTQNNNE